MEVKEKVPSSILPDVTLSIGEISGSVFWEAFDDTGKSSLLILAGGGLDLFEVVWVFDSVRKEVNSWLFSDDFVCLFEVDLEFFEADGSIYENSIELVPPDS